MQEFRILNTTIVSHYHNSLGGNHIADTGAMALADALKSNNTLKELR